MGRYDVEDVLRQYDEKEREGKEKVPEIKRPVPYPDLEAKAELARAKPQPSVQPEGRRDAGLSIPMEAPDYQKRAAAMVRNSLAATGVQKLLMVENRDNIRRGVVRGQMDVPKPKGAKAQVCTVQFPSYLMTELRQIVGPLSRKVTQNDYVTGFLYWFCGRPDGVQFDSDEAESRACEIADRMDEQASPAMFGRASFNLGEQMAGQIEELKELMQANQTLYLSLSKSVSDTRFAVDKSYIALVYMLLDRLGIAPAVGYGATAGDIDILAGGKFWDMDRTVGDGYDYYKRTDGREAYKAKYQKEVTHSRYASDLNLKTRPVAAAVPEPEEEDTSGDYYDDGSEDFGGDYEYESLPAIDEFDDFSPLPEADDADPGYKNDEPERTLQQIKNDAVKMQAFDKNFHGKVVQG